MHGLVGHLQTCAHACMQAYGLMGWRVGYIAYPNMDGQDALGQQLRKTLVRACMHACIRPSHAHAAWHACPEVEG